LWKKVLGADGSEKGVELGRGCGLEYGEGSYIAPLEFIHQGWNRLEAIET